MRKTSIVVLAAALFAPVAFAVDPDAGSAPLVTEEFGVIIIRGHLAAPAVVTHDDVEVLPPVQPPDYDRYADLRAMAELRREAIAYAVPPARPRRVRPAPPWTYTAPDLTYTPKTDWTYHPRAGKYTPQPTRWYMPKTEWTYTAKRFQSWY